MNRRPPHGLAILAVCLSAAASGCVVIAAGAGAGGAIHFTNNGAESVVRASVEATSSATERAFEHFGIERTSLKIEGDGAKREIEGKSAERDTGVSVKLEKEDEDTTRVEVSARKSLVTWDKDFAREIIEKIVEFAS